MAHTDRTQTPFSVLLGVIQAGATGALVSAISATLMTLPMALGAGGVVEALLAVIVLAFMVATPGAILVGLILVLAIGAGRRIVPGLYSRPILVFATFALLAAGLAALSALIVATVLSVPGEGNGGIDLRAMMIFSAAIGGVVLGTMLVRRLT